MLYISIGLFLGVFAFFWYEDAIQDKELSGFDYFLLIMSFTFVCLNVIKN